MMPMPRERIGSVVEETQEWTPLSAESQEPFRYIDIASIDSDQKRIHNASEIRPSEAPSRARQLVRSGDVLVSTVRPNLNAVAIVPDELDGATASTGLTVLRSNRTKLHPLYLYHWVRSPSFVRTMTARATGASYPAITDRIVKDSTLPLPPLAEQQRIAMILEKADSIRRLRRKSLQVLDEFLRSQFLETFGDPVRNEKGWELSRIGDLVVDVQYGTSAKANTERRGLPVLRMNNITRSGKIDLDEIKWCEVSPPELAKYTVRRGDMLFNRTNSPELVGKTAVWNRDDVFAFAGYLIRVRFDETRVLPEFVSSYLNSSSGKRMLFEKAQPSNNMSNISASGLKRLPIPLPPVDVQRQYLALYRQGTLIADHMEAAGLRSDSLFDSLVQRAFPGRDGSTISESRSISMAAQGEGR